jgi:hypothetical protein
MSKYSVFCFLMIFGVTAFSQTTAKLAQAAILLKGAWKIDSCLNGGIRDTSRNNCLEPETIWVFDFYNATSGGVRQLTDNLNGSYSVWTCPFLFELKKYSRKLYLSKTIKESNRNNKMEIKLLNTEKLVLKKEASETYFHRNFDQNP